jgi:hypothetical protein
MNQNQAHAKAVRVQALRYGRTTYATPKHNERSRWYWRRQHQLLDSIGVVLLLALFVGVEMGIAI